MCRLLAVISPSPFDPRDYLEPFTQIARDSREYQGHGWGCASRTEDGTWSLHHSITPIWGDAPPPLAPTTLFLAHARSAFRDEGIAVENNMPFAAGDDVFIFNGELRGVRIREDGRIGAEKIFNYIRRFRERGLTESVEHGSTIIERRTDHIRGMNIIMSDGSTLAARCRFQDDPDYFTLHERPATRDDPLVICSDPFPGEAHWQPFTNGEMRTYPCS